MDEIYEVGAPEAYIILKHKKPIGKYWMADGTKFIAIDNTRGEALAEDFDDQDSMMEWFEMDYADKFAKYIFKEAKQIDERSEP